MQLVMNEVGTSEKRRRGVLLSFQGWQRLQSAEQLAAVQRNQGHAFTLEQLSLATNLSPNTLTKVRRRQKPVDIATLEAYFHAFDLALEQTDLISPETFVQSSLATPEHHRPPTGSLPIASTFYVYRPPAERYCFQEILAPGALVRIKAPQQFGKTSLITQILGYARDQGLQTALVNLQSAEGRILEETDSFLRWFAASVTHYLGLANEMATHWDSTFGASYGCTDYFESYVLPTSDRPLLLVIDGFDELLAYKHLLADFCGLLRAWYERSRYGTKQVLWQRLRIVVAHSAEIWLPPTIHQSPFNVGLTVELPGFDLFQIKEIASRYELELSDLEAQQLKKLLGGHPFLTQLSLFHLYRGSTVEQLLKSAIALDGPYSSHLRRQLELIETDTNLAAAIAHVVHSPNGVKLHPREAFHLQGLGLVRFYQQYSVPSCDLYRQYFSMVFES